MARLSGWLGVPALALLVAASCGGESDDAGFSGRGGGGSGGGSGSGSGGMAGGSGGASAGTGGGGAGGTSGGAGGTSGGAGGTSGGAGGTSGAAGTGADATPCAPPARASDGALCLSFLPEDVAFENEPQLDGRGILFVQVFDTPTPDPQDGGPEVAPLLELIYPPQGDAGVNEVSVTELPEQRLDGLPSTVYVRAVFADNLAVFDGDDITWGVWLGGYDLTAGFRELSELEPLSLTAGAGTALSMPLSALRRLRVDVRLAASVTPLDDGRGPASILALRNQLPAEGEPLFGFGAADCIAVSSSAPSRVTGLLAGSGEFFIVAAVDDFNVGTGSLPPGSLVTLEAGDGGVSLPANSRLVVPPRAYSVDHTAILNLAVPAGDPAPPPFACNPADAGAD